MSGPEAKIEAYLRKRVRALHGKAFKFVSPGCVGVPDRILVFPDGTVIFCEVKSATGKLRPSQQRVIAHLGRLKCNVSVVRSKADVDEMLVGM